MIVMVAMVVFDLSFFFTITIIATKVFGLLVFLYCDCSCDRNFKLFFCFHHHYNYIDISFIKFKH